MRTPPGGHPPQPPRRPPAAGHPAAGLPQYQQPGPGYPPPGYPAYPGGPMGAVGQRNGMGTAALTVGIIGLVCGLTYFLWLFAIVLGILAIIFGSIGKGKAQRGEANNAGSATAGIVCGIVGMVIPLIYLAALDAAIDSAF
ncbi:DUF4190 domain-containing protein [Streptomyces pactum]|uniref:DUF4190 domain-containing protein n=1 Tax=Streptomyces pactum TaxID=68249 RepID=A0ABS0NPX8_9ACTN|nr:DUF4190 domain-containing protein [Streptomyces pactum]